MQPKLVIPSVLMRQMGFLKTASVAGTKDDLISVASGYALRATSSHEFVAGLLTADWTNDANNTPIQVTVDEFGIYEIDASTTLVQATHVGNAYDLSDYKTVNLGATSKKIIRVLGISPSGRAICGFNKNMIGSGAA